MKVVTIIIDMGGQRREISAGPERSQKNFPKKIMPELDLYRSRL